MTLPTAAQLDALRNQADPPADELLAQLVAEQGPAQAKATFDLLIRRVEMPLAELPPLVQDYWQSHQQLPARLDQEQLRIAQDFFVDHGPKLLVILYYKSLPMLYSCVKGAEVLVKTARLDRPQGDWRIFARRVAETAQFLLGVMRPGGLVNVGEGVQLIQKVRLIHASIRHFLLADGWDQSAFGLPINQEDMAITLCSFGISTLNGLERMGVEVAEEQKEAYVHVWSAVGEMLGIVPELLPDSVAAARALEEAILERQSGPSLAGQTLASALVQFAQERLNSRLLQTAPESLIRYFVGEKMAADLGLNHLPGCLSGLVPELLAGFFRKGERLEERSQPALQLLFDELSKVTMKAMFKYFDNYKQRTFVLHPELQRKWSLDAAE